MSRWWIPTAAVSMLSVMGGISQAQAQIGSPVSPSSPGYSADVVPSELPTLASPSTFDASFSGGPAPAQFTGQQIYSPTGVGVAGGAPYTHPAQQSGYVRLNAPLYPSPRPNIPIWTGSTMITNQAFAPHEMLYPHKYRAMYPPFYHRVHGCYFWTPFGMRSHEHWKLQGTMVQVKYNSHWPLHMGPHKQWVSTWHGPWK